jgi:hypothetical protein
MGHSQEDRSVPRLSDEELEYYGDLYTSRCIREASVDFENFLSNPEYYLAKYGKGDGRGNGGGAKRARGLLHFFRLWSAPRTFPS